MQQAATQIRPTAGAATTSGQSRTSAATPLPNAFMPTSVMRQMTKSSSASSATGGGGSLEEKFRYPNGPTSSTHLGALKPNVVPEHSGIPQRCSFYYIIGCVSQN
ncbi:unnamed protein product [Gongylonema pulchrum]|uniref:Uncharacterized protein n=1 Tax=Gongylonema pulchrum TaxID=637853 RepID=A0A183DKR4_9BILA|nr:unnamed protein product [Gongylonema pulchrum]